MLTINRLLHQILKYMDTVRSNHRWHAKVSTTCLIKRSKYIFHAALNVALYKSAKIDKAKQVDFIKKKCKQELFENKDIATVTTKCNWQIINTVKVSLKAISVLQ